MNKYELNSDKLAIRLPDFIIAGAMKCGTKSLHHILEQHPKIFIPNHEIHFFDIDDITQHHDFFIFAEGKWWYPKPEKEPKKYLAWYASFFINADQNQLIGEDSTTYLASHKAPARIATFVPNAKIIIMLRDPTSRTYSNYWHLVRTGRAMWGFEETLQLMPQSLMERSCYKYQIEWFMKFIPVKNLHFILFEEFTQNMPAVMKGVEQFLGLGGEIVLSKIETHRNFGRTPRIPVLQLWRNRLLRLQARRVYLHHLPEVPPVKSVVGNLLFRAFNHIHGYINPLRPIKPPPMHPQTRKFLNAYFAHENKGLSDLIGKDVDSLWYGDD